MITIAGPRYDQHMVHLFRYQAVGEKNLLEVDV